jgi:23S rRNA (cytidine1920-2'-O)/16S rRNA (cytidine1409-2'-O)-methyltransferase
MAGRRARLDAELVRRGLAATRSEAARLVAEGRVTVRGAPAMKPSTQVAAGDALAVRAVGEAYVSRGGRKLATALDELAVPVASRSCLDAGASTGGFTDVLLRRGAIRVVAVDVGYGQLDWGLRQNPRVVVLERTNARHLTPEQLPPPPPELVVADLSFISLTLVLPALRAVATPGAEFVLLVKPQFEAGPGVVGRGGVVRDPRVWRDAMGRVVAAAAGLGLGFRGATVSRFPGPSGNIEFFVALSAGAGADVEHGLTAAILAAETLSPKGI